jgi:hypothetical protein
VKKLHEWKNEIARRGLRGFLRFRENDNEGSKKVPDTFDSPPPQKRNWKAEETGKLVWCPQISMSMIRVYRWMMIPILLRARTAENNPQT